MATTERKIDNVTKSAQKRVTIIAYSHVCCINNDSKIKENQFAGFSNTIMDGGNVAINTYSCVGSKLERIELLSVLSLMEEIKRNVKPEFIYNIHIHIPAESYLHRSLTKNINRWISNGFKNRRGIVIGERDLWGLFLAMNMGTGVNVNWLYDTTNNEWSAMNMSLAKKMALEAQMTVANDTLPIKLKVEALERIIGPFQYVRLVNKAGIPFPVIPTI